MTAKDRAIYLGKFADALEERTQDAATIWTSESGAVAALAQHGAAMGAATLRYYASLAETFQFEEQHTPETGGIGLLVREPVGVVGAIIPWNGPLNLLIYKIAPALLAGCTVVAKMPPEAPYSGYLLAEIAEAIGLPAGVFNVVTADREVSELLVRNPGVDKITFTGSTVAGRKIGAICAERVARCTLELGGKSAAIVLDDYDVGAVAQSLAQSAPVLAGQVCASLTRIIVPRYRHDELVDALAGAFSQVPVGDPFDMNTGMGPLAMARQRDRVESFIAQGIEQGAMLATGGHRPAHLDRGYFIEPTVFGNVDNSMAIAREEIFGPVLSVIPAESEADAVRIANDSIYGLNASVFTRDPQRARAVAREIRSGTVGHNAQRIDFTIGFGGYKQSGIGREGGVEGLKPYLETKAIILEDAAQN
jgi:acyl-CoA reductase-like NAD-dependent aldehyde dehydrogenase